MTLSTGRCSRAIDGHEQAAATAADRALRLWRRRPRWPRRAARPLRGNPSAATAAHDDSDARPQADQAAPAGSHNGFPRESHRAAAVSGAHRFRPGLRDAGQSRRGDPGVSRRPQGRRKQKAGAVPGRPTRPWHIGESGAPSIALGRFAQAETHYQKALKLSPKDPKIWNDAGYSYYLQGRWADAERGAQDGRSTCSRGRANSHQPRPDAGRRRDAPRKRSRS